MRALRAWCFLLSLCCMIGALNVTDAVRAEETPQTAAGVDDVREEQGEQAFFSSLRNQLYRSVSGSSRWFDSFFGESGAYQERDESYGKLGTHLFWNEDDGFEPRVRFHVKCYLPKLENRWNLFIGRINQQQFLHESAENKEQLSQQDASLEPEEDWLLGLGFHPLRNERERLDFQAGANMKLMPELFAKTRYRANIFLGKKTLFRFRETLFWEQEDGFGSSSRIDFDRLLGKRFLLRWANSGKISEISEGFEWRTGLVLYQNITEVRALSYETWMEGATDAPVALKSYGAQMIYRQNLEGNWLFGELRGGVSWPQKRPEDEREMAWGAGIGLELHFGEK